MNGMKAEKTLVPSGETEFRFSIVFYYTRFASSILPHFHKMFKSSEGNLPESQKKGDDRCSRHTLEDKNADHPFP